MLYPIMNYKVLVLHIDLLLLEEFCSFDSDYIKLQLSLVHRGLFWHIYLFMKISFAFLSETV
ncbi:hypothetical protein [Lysinibacillus sp. LZ02]|uniref:hypothetical protein n=1 Tax=Lysinibacillus sp. LZ02 TaxID=3420668 RepID=UPI003D36567C